MLFSLERVLILLSLFSVVSVSGVRRTRPPDTVNNACTAATITATTITTVTTPASTTTSRTTTTTTSTSITATTTTTTTRTSTTTTSTSTSTTTTTSTGNSVTYTLYEQQALAESNYLRSLHCAPPLRFNSDIETIAQTYAQHLCDTNTFAHSGNQYQNQPLGENLYGISSTGQISLTNRNGSIPIDTWYSEIQYYNFATPEDATNALHFTQEVWLNSQYFGLGYCCTSTSLTCYVVANYFPAGNYVGSFAANVEPTTCNES